jgi:tripartite-type tricarboxylate transporter receptor subunit TctC
LRIILLRTLFTASALALVACSSLAVAQYPNKPVRVIVPFSPGGSADTLGRALNQKLSEEFGHPVVIENRSGGGGNIGADVAAKSPPDGYTLVIVTISHAINVSVYRKLSYNLVRDFTPVTLLAETAHTLVTHPSLPVKSGKELIAFAGKRPGQIDYASSGTGSSAHLSAALFESMARVKMNHIPYKGGGPAVVAIYAGEVSIGFPTLPSVVQYVKSGRLRGLAVTTARRAPSLPDLPTLGEAGLPGYETFSWMGLLVPAGTPPDIVTRLNTVTVKLLKMPDIKKRLSAAGFDAVGNTPEEFGALMRSEIEKWGKMAKITGLRQE